MRLKELRKNKKISQTELAKAIDTNQKNISNYENSDNQTIELLIKLADYFDVSLDYLVERRHQNKVDLSNLSETQKNIINLTKELNELNAGRVESYIIAKLEEQQDQTLKNKKIN